MTTSFQTKQALLAENAELRAQLEIAKEAAETLRAIRAGEVEALVIQGEEGPQVFTLASAENASNRFRGEILTQISDAVVALDNEQRVTFFNAAAERLYGVAEGDALGRQLADIYQYRWVLPGDETEAARALYEHGEWRGENIHVLRDGREIYVESTVTVLRDGDGASSGLLAIIREITERKQAEERLAELNEDLRRRSVELAASNKELESFAYSVSHDLRAPLRTIDGFAQALGEDHADKLNADAQEQLRRIRAAAQRMARLIDDLLSLSRVARMEMNRQPVRLSVLVRTVAEELQASDRNRKVDFRIQQGVSVNGDAVLLRMVIENLLENAWKFTGKLSLAVIEFGTMKSEGGTAVFVRDNGAGFDMAFANKLFGVFQRLHKSSEFPGTGVGLATVQRIVHRHGGRVWAESELEKGATFMFTLG